MTRINVIPVRELSDNFILAEFWELPRLWTLIYKAMSKSDKNLPDTYRMGEGHVRFFYNKITYLDKRHSQLWHEGNRRGLPLDKDPSLPYWYDDVLAMADALLAMGENPLFWFQDYEPTPEAVQLNRDRLHIRRAYTGGIYERRTEAS